MYGHRAAFDCESINRPSPVKGLLGVSGGFLLESLQRLVESLLTDLRLVSGRCLNSDCRQPLKQGKRNPGTVKKYCGGKCRNDAAAIRRVNRLLDDWLNKNGA